MRFVSLLCVLVSLASMPVSLAARQDHHGASDQRGAMVMGFDQLYDPKHPGKQIDPPADLAAWVAALPEVTVAAQTPVEVGGVAATQVDMRTGDVDVPFGPTDLTDLPSLGFGAHQHRRVILVLRAGTAIIIGLGSIKPGDDTAERSAIANDILEPIVESIAWE